VRERPFHSISTHHFIRATVGIPFLRVADPAFNVERTIGLARTVEPFALHVEICEDVWALIPPSTIGKADYRRSLGAAQSGKCSAAYPYPAAGRASRPPTWSGTATP